MSNITDWLMVIITGIYVIATIVICRANLSSARATQEQLIEMKREHDEDVRLSIMPYFELCHSLLYYRKEASKDKENKSCHIILYVPTIYIVGNYILLFWNNLHNIFNAAIQCCTDFLQNLSSDVPISAHFRD